MRFIVLLFTFMFVSTSYAEWNWFQSGQTEVATFYIDYDKVRKVGNHVYFYELRDHVEPVRLPAIENSGIFSIIIYSKVTCDTNMRLILQIQNYQLAMGKGELVLTPKGYLSNKWEPYDDNYGKSLTRNLCENY